MPRGNYFVSLSLNGVSCFHFFTNFAFNLAHTFTLSPSCLVVLPSTKSHAMTFSLLTLGIMTLGKMTFGMMTLGTMKLGIMILGTMIFGIMTLVIMTLSLT
jgi:hypothetical protein